MLIERTPPRRQATSPSRTPASQSHPLSAAKASTSKSSSTSKPVAQSYAWEPLESLGSSRREHGERFMTSTNSAAGANAVSASLPRPSPSRPGAQYDTAANRAAKGGRDLMLMADSGHSGRNSGPRNSLNNLNSMRDTAGDETPKAVKEARHAREVMNKTAVDPPAQMETDQISASQAPELSRSPEGSRPASQPAAKYNSADSNQSTPRATRPKPQASVERPLPALAAKADKTSSNATAGSSSSASAANDEFERKLLAAMAQAEAGVNPFLDARKAEMRGESMAAAAKQASRILEERRNSAVEAVMKQSDAIEQDVEVAEEGHDAAAEEEEEEEVTVTEVVTDDATASSKIVQTTSSHAPSTGQRTEDSVLIEQRPSMRTDVEDAEEADAPETVPIGGTEGAHPTDLEPLQRRTDQQTQKADTVAIELQTVKDENARWQSLVAELKADLEEARKASSPAAGPLEVANTSAPVNEDAAAVRAKYEALKTSYLELKVAKDEVTMQQLEAMEATTQAQLEICALRFQVAVEKGRREAAETAAAAAAANISKMASPIAAKTVLPAKSSALDAAAKSVPKSTATAPAGSSKSSVASIAARKPAKANSQMASDVMPPSSAAAATDDEESHLASPVEDAFDDEDELDAPMSPVRSEPVRTGKGSAAISRAAPSKPEPASKRTMVAPQPRKRPVYANLDDEEDVAEPHGASSDIDEEVDSLPTKKHKSSSNEVTTKSKSGSTSSTAAKKTSSSDATTIAAPAKASASKTSTSTKPAAGTSKAASSTRATATTTTRKQEPAPAPAKAPVKQPAPTTKTTSKASAPSKAARRMTFDRAELKEVGHASDSDSDDDMHAVDDNDDEGDETAFVLPTKKKNTKEAAAPVSTSSKTAKAGAAAATSKPAPTAAAAAPATKKKRRLLGPSKMPFDASSQRGDVGGDRGGARGMAIDDGSESENLLNPALEIPLILSPVKGFGGVGGGVPAAGGQVKKGKFGLGANANRFGGGGRGMFG